MAWLTGWQYRKKITITGQTGAGTFYQVLLKVGESSGSPEADFHIGNNSQSFPTGKNESGDLRFTDDDETTLLDFWVEQVTGESPNKVAWCWVEVADDLETNKDIYCYCRKSSPDNVSNGANTFIFFDDFPGSSLNTDKWDIVGSPTIDVSNSIITITAPGSGGHAITAKAGITDRPCSLRHKGKVGLVASGKYMYIVGWTKDSPASALNLPASENDAKFLRTYVAPSEEKTSLTEDITQYYTYEAKWRSAGTKFYMDDVLKATHTSVIPDGSAQWRLWTEEINSNILCDWVLTKKYIDPEPAFNTAGDGEMLQFCAENIKLIDNFNIKGEYFIALLEKLTFRFFGKLSGIVWGRTWKNPKKHTSIWSPKTKHTTDWQNITKH